MPRSNGEMYEFVMRKGYMKTHATGILKHLQEEGRLEVVEIETGRSIKKGIFYLNYEGVNSPKVRFILK